MEFPVEVRNKIEVLCAGFDSRALAKAAERLSENYRAESSAGKRSAESECDIAAYCAVRMPATFAAVSRALELALERFVGEIRTVLDIGAGTGAGSIAADSLLEGAEFTLIEREPNMIAIGKQLTECIGIHGNWIRGDITNVNLPNADLVICAYCLNELPESRRKAVVERLGESARKLLLIVEPGTPNAFAGIRKTRLQLTESGFTVVAPCPDIADCPMADGDWCHFSARAARSKLHKRLKNADAPYEDEKFCFLAITRESADSCGFRILRHPEIQPGRVTLKLCGADGLSTETVTKSNPAFKAARKADWGDLFDK